MTMITMTQQWHNDKDANDEQPTTATTMLMINDQ